MTRHVIVTGGSRGLGFEIARGLLQDGYHVSSCSRNHGEALAALLQEYPRQFFWREAIIGELCSMRAFVDAAMAWHDGPLYGLINNAGIAREGILASFPSCDSAAILETNLLGAIEMARLALRQMLQQAPGGRILNISSIIGQRGYTGLAAYSASKAGMDGLTRALAREVGRRAITVNSIAPGYLETEMSSGLAKTQREQIIRRTPLGRLGHSGDIVPLVRFLLSDAAGFLTGQVITVDGGIGC